MKMFRTRPLVAALFALAPLFASAQAIESADEILATSLSALRQIDEGRTDAIWDQTSAFVKAKMTKDDFVNGIKSARARLGPVASRNWAGVIRIKYLPGSVEPPPGMYANADFSSLLKDGRTVFEKVTLRQEPDGWHLIGYVPRDTQ